MTASNLNQKNIAKVLNTKQQSFPHNKPKPNGFRAMLKNDNFYMATQQENQKKKLLQNQKVNLPSHKLDIQQRKKIAQDIKQQKHKQKIKIHDRQIFQQNNNNDFGFGFDEFIGANPKKKKQDDDFELFKKKIQKKKEKKTIDQSLQNANKFTQTNINSQQIQEKKDQLTTANNDTQKKENIKLIVTSKNNNNKDDDDNFDELLLALKTKENDSQQQKVQKPKQSQKTQHQQKSTSHVFKKPAIFQPKSSIVQVLPDPQIQKNKQKPKSTYQLNKQRSMFQKKIKKQLADLQIERKKQQQGGSQQQGDQKQKGKDGKQKKKTTNKKVKNVKNYQRLDLKRKYKDQFVGGLKDAQRKYMKNGVLKPKFRMAQTQLEMEHSEVYNNYVHSLSKSFKVEIALDSDSEEVQIEPPKNIEIPRIEDSSYERLTEMINDFFGFEKFREGQYQVVENILNQKSTIFISQTASGKSLTYIISAMIMAKQSQGMSIVISPLIALMLDQLQHLPHELPAACISSLINYQQRERIIQLVKSNQVKLLFMTPQTLQSDILFNLSQFPKINFVCIDEAHCLSELSHNFRTSYMALAQIIKNHISYNNEFHKPNILCLTATANTQTVLSLSRKLQIDNIIKSSSTLNKNLYITVTRQIGLQDKFRSLVNYLNQQEILKCRGILIYSKAKWIIQKIINYLNNSGVYAVPFHGELPPKEKTKIISQFKQREIRIIVSTVALGMGLDFQHLDCIIHFNMSKSLESFVQEIGRAGRRQYRAYCQLFLDATDFYFERNYILADQLQQVSLKTIVSEMTKTWKGFTGKKKRYSKDDNISSQKKKRESVEDKKKQMDRIIKRASMVIQKMQQQRHSAPKMQQNQDLYQQNINEKDHMQEQQSSLSNPFSQDDSGNNNNDSKWSTLYFLRTKQLSQKTMLREQALLGILMKLSSTLNIQMSNNNINQQLNPSLRPTEIMKIHPLSHQILKLSFFKTNQKLLIQSKQHGEFYSKLVDIDLHSKQKKAQCKKISGAYHINLIQKCNQLQMSPIQIMTKVYQISNLYTMKIQLVTQVYLFSLKDKVITDEHGRKIHYQKILKKDVQLCLQNRLFQQNVISEVNKIQNTAMTKLQVFYSLAFEYSQKSVSELKKKGLIIDRASPIPKDNVMNKITDYFNTDLVTFYHKLTQTEDQFEREMYLPTESIQSSQRKSVYEYMKLFFKHQFSNLRDMSNHTQVIKKKQAIIEQYKDGKIITRVFLGVNEQKSSRFIFGSHSYWRVFLKKKYFPLLKTVRQLIQDERQDILNS